MAETPVGVRSGRRPLPYTRIHQWVSLSGISPRAVALYGLLRMHVNRERADDLVWTTTLTLAVMLLGPTSRGDKISPLLKELVEIGAIDIMRGGIPRRNIYVVHELPPAGYTGPMTLQSWYALNEKLLAGKRAHDKQVRDARRARRRPDAQQPVAPDPGQQAVTPDPGQPDPPDPGQPVAPKSGRKLDVSELHASELPPTPATVPAVLHGLEAREQGLADEALALALCWSPQELYEVLADERIRGRSWELVREAVLLAAGDGGQTWTPRRLLAPGCPYWRTAATRIGSGTRRPAPPAAATLPWCGEPDCDQTTRQIIDPQTGIPAYDAANGRWRRCPRCSQSAAAHPPTAAGEPDD